MATYRQQDVQNPHFRLPFQFGGIKGGALMNEQDTEEDITDCIRVIIAFPVGSRHDMPEFGIPELLFRQDGEGLLQELRDVVEEWEDRATLDIDGEPAVSDSMIWNVLIEAGIANDG